MIKRLYSVYDKKAKSGLGVFEQPNDLVAIRDFSRVVSNNNAENMIAKYSEDYCLLCLGEYETETGVITSNVRTIAEAQDYVSKENPDA